LINLGYLALGQGVAGTIAICWRMGRRSSTGADPVRDQEMAMSSNDEHLVMKGVWDFDGYAVSINPVHEATLGWSVWELSSAPFWELLHPDDRDRSVEMREQALLNGPAFVTGYKVRVLCRDGTYRSTQWDIRSASEEERMYVAGVDISDQEPIVNEERMRVGSWEWRIASNTATWSPGMYEIYGLAPGPECNLASARQRWYAEDRVIMEQAIQRSVTSGEPFNSDHRIVHPIDGIRWLHCIGRVFLDENGNPQEVRGLTWDITDLPGAGSSS
jgi:PAS domain S-box-containing protein